MTTLVESSPGQSFLTHDERFAEVLGHRPRLVKVADVAAHEGPVYAADEDALYYTTVPRRPAGGSRPVVAIERIALDGGTFPVDPSRVSVVCADANVANGMILDCDGRLLVCEQGTFGSDARIARLDPGTGETETLVSSWAGLPLNSPNDVVVAPAGAVWFTDPSYGWLQGFRPEPAAADAVYRFDRLADRLDVVAVGFDKPNGLAFSPDGAVLYVGDSGAVQGPGSFHAGRPHHVLAFDVVGGRRLAAERLFASISPGFPDGLEVDAEGRLYVSSASGVQVFDPEGDRLGEILLPGAVNFCFGGPGRNVLFITCDTAVWAAVLTAKGA
jgi:gluconolactonase